MAGHQGRHRHYDDCQRRARRRRRRYHPLPHLVPPRDQNRPGRVQAVMQAYDRCATAMLQTTIIGGLGLAVFATSTFTPTQQFGYLMISMLAAALIGDLLLLPADPGKSTGRMLRRKDI